MAEPSSRVQDMANLAHRLCMEAGRDELGDLLRAQAQRYSRAATTVVVVGDENRGKSTLINALVGDDVLPTDADVTTGAYIALTHGDHRAGHVYLADADRPVPVSIDDLADWATVHGREAEHDVEGVVVTLDSPLLAEGLHLVDTPGVGGLDASLTEITLAALPTADIVIFVLDPTTPLSSSELRFLDRAAQRVGVVVFAMSRVDLAPGWEQIIDEDRSLLRSHAPRFSDAPIIGVSPYLERVAARSEAAGETDLAEEARRRSGMAALRGELAALTADSRVVKLSNLLQVVDVVLAELGGVEQVRLESATANPGLEARLEDHQRRLERVTDASARWRVDLDYSMKQLSYDFETRVEEAISELEKRLMDAVRAGGKGLGERVRAELESELPALWAELSDYLRQWLTATFDRLVEQLVVEIPEIEVGGLGDPARVLQSRAETPVGNDDLASTFLKYYPAAFAAVMPTTMAGWLGLGALVPTPFLMITGLGVAGTMVVARRSQDRMAKDRRRAIEATRTTLTEAKKQLQKQLARELTSARRLLESEISGRLLDRRRLLERQLKDAREFARKDETERARARTLAERRLSEITDARRRVEELRGELHRTLRAGAASR